MTSNNSDVPIPLQEIIANLPASCLRRWPDAEAARAHEQRLAPLVDVLHTISPRLKQKKIEKQECARDFGQAKRAGQDLTPLKARMQEISAELDVLEQQVRDAEVAIGLAFTEEPDNAIPPRFEKPCIRFEGAVTVEQLAATDSDVAEWTDYVNAHPQASRYHDYRWRQVITDSFGHSTFYLVARDAERRIRGVLPLIRLRSLLFGDFAVSVPFFNYGGPLADHPCITAQLLEQAAAIAKSLPIKHLEIRATQVLNNWPTRSDKVSMILKLPSTEEALDKQLGTKLRAQIKRARQEKNVVCVGGEELLSDFYRVFSINMRDLGTPVYSKHFFANILRAFPETARLVCVRHNGKPVSAAFLIGHGDMLEIPWASTLREANPFNMNMLLYREILGFAVNSGYMFFDFGRSTIDAGTYHFKKQWGAVPVQHYWHYWLPDGGELPALKPDSPKFKLLVSCWQRLPVTISRLLGPHIVKSLP